MLMSMIKDDFRCKMSIDSMTFKDDGGFEIWYDDGELFFGHSITVYINAQDIG